MVETREQYMTRTGFWPGFPMDHYDEEAFAAMQRAAEFGPHGHKDEVGQKPGSRFGKAREVYASMSTDQRAARRFGRNPQGFTPSAV